MKGLLEFELTRKDWLDVEKSAKEALHQAILMFEININILKRARKILKQMPEEPKAEFK